LDHVVYTPAGTRTITASPTVNGTIDPSGAVTVKAGSDQTFTITPNPGYKVLTVVLDSSPSGSLGPVTSYTFKNVTADHTIQAAFALDTRTIYASTGGAKGAISPSGAVAVTPGSDQTFTITPNPGRHVKDVLVDGVSKGALKSYTFTNINEHHTIVANFEINDIGGILMSIFNAE
jgi:hypothetical protein